MVRVVRSYFDRLSTKRTWVVVGMLVSCYGHAMANLQVKNIPDALHERLRRHARDSNRTMSAVVLAALERELARREWPDRLAGRPETDLKGPASALLVEARSARDAERG